MERLERLGHRLPVAAEVLVPARPSSATMPLDQRRELRLWEGRLAALGGQALLATVLMPLLRVAAAAALSPPPRLVGRVVRVALVKSG